MAQRTISSLSVVNTLFLLGRLENLAFGQDGRTAIAMAATFARRARAKAAVDDVTAGRTGAAARTPRGPPHALAPQRALRTHHVSHHFFSVDLTRFVRLGRLEAGQPPQQQHHEPQQQQQQQQQREEVDASESSAQRQPSFPGRTDSAHHEVYGWVPSELGIPDADPAALAQILDAERESRPYMGDVARRGHQRGDVSLQAPLTAPTAPPRQRTSPQRAPL